MLYLPHVFENTRTFDTETDFSLPEPCFKSTFTCKVEVKVKVSHSLIAVGAVGVRVPLYLGHS